MFHQDRFITDFKQKAELFNSSFACQCSLISSNNKISDNSPFLSDKSLPSLAFTDDSIVKSINGLNRNKVHGHGIRRICSIKLSGNSIS